MTLVMVAATALLVGLLLALGLPTNRARVAAALVTQAIATGCTTALAASVLATGRALEASIPWSYPVERVTLVVDPLSAFFLVWSMPMTFLGAVYASGYLAADLARDRNAGPHFALLNLLSISYLLVYSLQDTVGFLLGWEIAAVSAWLLVIWSYRDQKVRFAGFNYLVSTHIGLFVLAAALMVLRGQTGATVFSSFAEALARPGHLRTLTFLLLGAAFGLKAAFFPGHTWLPRAHAAAPAHISALMSGVIHKAGLYGFLRFTLLLGRPEEWMGWSVLAFGAASAVVGALFSTSQRDLKRLLGYSSTENVGIAAMGFGVGYLGLAWDEPAVAALGFAGGTLHVLNHAWFKCLLFYGAGAVYRAAHTVDLERLGGLARRMPLTTAWFALGSAAIAGLPPLNGFGSEFLIYAALFAAAQLGGLAPGQAPLLVAFAATLALTGAMSAFAVIRALGIGFLGTPRDPAHPPAGGDPGMAMLLPMTVHAVGIVAFGLFPPLGGWVVAPVARMFADPGPALAVLAALRGPVWALCGLLAAAGLATVWAGWRARRHVTWGCGYTAATPRMQYTATSFAQPLTSWFASVMPEAIAAHLPSGWFPPSGGTFRSTHPDPVEQRIFSVLGRGEEWMTTLFAAVTTEPRVVFALGLVGLLAGLAIVVWGGA